MQYFDTNFSLINPAEICWSIILWNRPGSWPIPTDVIYCQLDESALNRIGGLLYSEMLEFGEDYFEEIGDIPKPVPVSVLKDNPNLLDVYIKSNMWSNILIEYLSGLSGFCQGREKWSLINMEKIVKRNSLFYITFNAVRNNQKT